MNELRVSATKLKSIRSCAWSFYVKELLKLPETTHKKTLFGSTAHSILECLRNPRHRHIYDNIMNVGSIDASPAVLRLARMWQEKHDISDEIMAPLDSCVMCVLDNFDFFHTKAVEVFPPEWEFSFSGKDYKAKGFLDDFAIYVDSDGNRYAKIRDWKTIGDYGVKDEKALMEGFEIQATMYQLAIMKKFGIEADATFVLVRYPPTAAKPNRHIRFIPRKTKAELDAFELYLEYFGRYLKNFGLQEAMGNFCADNPKKKFFCTKVCQFREKMEYVVHLSKDGNIIRGYFLDDDMPKLADGEKLEIREYSGCPRFGGRLA